MSLTPGNKNPGLLDSFRIELCVNRKLEVKENIDD